MDKKDKIRIEYDEAKQEALLQFLVSSDNLFARCRQIIKPAYFDHKFRKTVRFILEYADEYNTLPDEVQIKSETGLPIQKVDREELEKKHSDWFLKEIEQFCRHRAIENIIETSPEHITGGLYNKVESDIREAVLISLQKELGVDYFNDLQGIVTRLQDRNAITSTGWRDIDSKLYGGFNRGELNIFAGAPGQGKSLFLQNLALNWVEQGKNVVYLTFELSEELVGLRFHAMLASMSTKDVHKKKDEAIMAIAQGKRKNNWGALMLKFMPVGTRANDIKAYLKEYEIQTGIVPDALIVDYLDLLHPNNARVSPSDLFVKDKYVSEELRSLAAEQKILFATASQLNRTAMEETEHEMYHIAGGVSKINTADNVMTLYTSESMKQRGEYRIQFIKTRSSSGVGQKVFLKFDVNSLRISDLNEAEAEAAASSSAPPPSQQLDAIRRTSNTIDTSGSKAEDKGRDLRSIINRVNPND